MGSNWTQSKYISKFLTKANMSTTNSITITACSKQRLILKGTLFQNPTLYRSIVGGLQYLCMTHPNICFSVNQASQFMHSPTENHWVVVKRILRNLRATPHHGLYLQCSPPFNINVYSDANWGGNPEDQKSTKGFAIFGGHNLTTWSFKK